MELRNKLFLFLLLSVCSVSCFPSRPLNDRPSELTWQAWLLVDSQNQLQNESDRRITPKSVFIAPKLGQRNDSLPDCADGYRADSMGRCIKFVKVDEAAHLNFLLSRLNEMYAANSDEDIEESDESMPTAGPLQVNIPLGQSDEYDSEETVKETTGVDILIPNNEQFDDKLNVKRQENTKPVEKINEKETEILPQVDEDYTDENIQTTTEDRTETTTEYETTEMSTTEETTGTTEISITTIQNVPNDELKALFFLMPTKNNTEIKNTTDTLQEVTLTTTQKPIIVTLKEDIQSDSQHFVENITPFKENLPLIQKEENNHKESPFKQQNHPIRSPPMRFPEETSKYPEETEEFIRFPLETNIDIKEQFPANVRPHYGPVLHHRPHNGELTSEQIQEIFKQYVHKHTSYDERPQIPPDRVYNHRNRDRNEDLWSLMPTIKEDKPLLMRFGRYPSPYYPSQDEYPSQKRQSSHHEIKFFDDDTRQDYSSMYGRKRRRGNLR